MPYPYQSMNVYARGDYYQGDLFGRLIGGVKGAVGGFLKGGPIGAIKGGVTGALGKPSIAAQAQLPPPPLALIGSGRQGPDLPARFPGAVPEPGFRGAVQRFLPFGQTGFTGAPPGYHVNKAYLRFLRAQGMGKAVQDPFSETRAKNVVVRNRKLNPLNHRALKRATARIRGVKRVMGRALAGTGFKITRSGLGGRKGRKR